MRSTPIWDMFQFKLLVAKCNEKYNIHPEILKKKQLVNDRQWTLGTIEARAFKEVTNHGKIQEKII